MGTVLLMAGVSAPPAIAADCMAQFTPRQREVYSSLSPQNQKRLASQKNKDGSPASCEFQKGVLDMLSNFTPDKRNSGFETIAHNMFAS
ncbi:MAG TPA: hypothetical protein VJ718_04870 [Candidatus Binataceae bacterium]|nr:hypothetical protein [Candidatus Binataceae bacterium]